MTRIWRAAIQSPRLRRHSPEWLIGLPFIYWQLWQMEKYHRERSRILDEREAELVESNRRLDQLLKQPRQARPHPSN